MLLKFTILGFVAAALVATGPRMHNSLRPL
jgi:hypothetical protein